MKKFTMIYGKAIATLALVMATINVNSACIHYLYQEQVPEQCNRLSKIK